MRTKMDPARLIRIVIAVAFGLLVVIPLGMGIFYERRASEPPGRQAAFENASCKQCHPDVWNEWDGSMHARAWRDPTIQASFQNFGFDRKCQSCHAPEPRLFERAQNPSCARQS